MAKAKKTLATRKRSSKRLKAGAKAARKALNRGKRKQGRSKVRGAAKVRAKARRPAKLEKKKASSKPRGQVADLPVRETIIDVIEEPIPGTIIVTEYEAVRTTSPISASSEASASPEREGK
jgi:hypothetical protein